MRVLQNIKEERMRTIQKVITIVYCVVVAVACIYVPWKTDFLTSNYSKLDYNFSPPHRLFHIAAFLHIKSY